MKRLLLLFAFTSFILSTNAQVAATHSSNHEITTGQRVACDTLFSFPVLSQWCGGIAWDGEHLWQGGFTTSEGAYAYAEWIYRYTVDGNIIDSIPAPSLSQGISGLTFDGTNLWALLEETNQIVELDINDGTILSNYTYPELATNGWDMSFDGTYLWAAGYSPGILLQIDPQNGAIISQLNPTVATFTIEYVGDYIYAREAFGLDLYRIDPQTGEVIDSQPWCIPYQAGLCWNGEYMWCVSSLISSGGNQRAYGMPLVGVTHVQSPSTQSAQNIFPNPARDIVTIELDDRFDELVDVQIWSLEGQLIESFSKRALAQGNLLELRTEQLNQGVYTVVVTSGDASVAEKVVIQR
jgi:glutamine cyclotransferase